MDDEKDIYDEHEEKERALMEEKSLDALKFLINHGREVEFSLNANVYFMSKDGSKKNVSIWKDEKEQAFDSFDKMIKNAQIEKKPFLSVWDKVDIEFIF